MRAERAIVAALVLLGCAAACGPEHNSQAPIGPAQESTKATLGASYRPRPTLESTQTTFSNVARNDYAGSSACRPCHADVVHAWEASPMHRMTRSGPMVDIRGPFDGTRFHFKDDIAVLDRRGDDRFIQIEGAKRPSETYRVTRVIGGRTREDYAGVDIRGGTEEVILPVSYVIETGALRYKGYSVMVRERPSLQAGPVWSKACIFCHNTIPEIDRLLGTIAGPGAHPYQGVDVDRWLPSDRQWNFRVSDNAAFAKVVGLEMLQLGAPSVRDVDSPRSIARSAIDTIRQGFTGGSLVEEGIGCEACHGGARQHANDPRVPPSFVPTAPWLNVARPDVTPSAAANHVCARCHQVLFSRYPFTWEGGRRNAAAGGSHINSGEARDFLLGACASEMTCTACHDPHGKGDKDALTALATPKGNGVCTHCHSDLSEPDRQRAHSHHDPARAGGACVGCHMPRKNMGLSGTLTRYHRIGSPTDPARVLGDRPLECALCHADKTVGALVGTMESWWNVRYPRQRLEELYGSLDASPLRATLSLGKPHEQAVAMARLAETGARDAAPLITPHLLSAYPLVREWAKRSLVSLIGKCDVDLSADDATIAKEAASCGGSAAAPSVPAASSEEEPED